MKLETFFEKFDQFADAPDAVPRMRDLVLQLAVQGKLVPQNPNDEPAEKLLELIAARFLKPARRPRVGNEHYEPDDAKIFRLPAGWTWARFPELGEFGRGKSKHRPRNDPALFIGGAHRVVQTGDVARANGIIQTHTGLYNDFGLGQSRKWPAGTLCITIAANIADSGILGFDACFPDSVVGFIPTQPIPSARYFEYFVRTAKKHLELFAPSTAQKNISLGILEQVSIPLPPLAEQKRIVAKVDELMALCDRLETQQQEREEKHAALARASLSRFADAPNPTNLNFLFHKSYAIPTADLRKSILTLAVQGKLVPQDPNDEPVEELLTRISTERRKLDLTAKTAVQPINDGDKLGYDIPVSWRWQTLDCILIFGPTNGFSPRAVDYETPVRSLTLSATTAGRFKAEHSKFITTEVPPDSELWLRNGDILVQRGNTIEYVGVAAVYSGPPNSFVYPDLMMKLRVASALHAGFIHLAMSQESARDFLRARASGTSGTMPKINQSTLKNLPVPIPPIAEQRRIVARVDQLMALVDRLETQLATSRATGEKLMEALVAELTSTEKGIADET